MNAWLNGGGSWLLAVVTIAIGLVGSYSGVLLRKGIAAGSPRAS